MSTNQRPLTGEPLSLDLVNTQWRDGDTQQDLFLVLDDVRDWLEEVGIVVGAVPLEAVVAHLIEVRAIIRALLKDSSDLTALDAFNGLLRQGTVQLSLNHDGPVEQVIVDEALRPAWLAARDYLNLMASMPDRIHNCGEEQCILYFLDTTKNGSRRWCRTDTCGNRVKRRRFYRKHAR